MSTEASAGSIMSYSYAFVSVLAGTGLWVFLRSVFALPVWGALVSVAVPLLIFAALVTRSPAERKPKVLATV